MRLPRRVVAAVREGYELLSVPVLAAFLLVDPAIDARYHVTYRRALRLTAQMRRTTRRVPTGTSFRAHVGMAAKILAIPPEVEGALVEAGCWKGGTTANLSTIAELVGRDLIVYDSFEGLPPPVEGDRWAHAMHEGAYEGNLEEVQRNVAANGSISRCQFRKGWFSDTLPGHAEPIVAAFVDVDHQASMHQCLLGLWPHLVDTGYLFIDEYVRLDYCAVFFSERYWRTYFDRPPPGLMGTGTGAAVGHYFLGPFRSTPPLQAPRSMGWTRKDFYGEWDYWPDDAPVTPLAGGPGAAHGPEGWYVTEAPVDDVARKLVARSMHTAEGRPRFERALTESSRTAEGSERISTAMHRKYETPQGKREVEAAFEARAQTEEGRAHLERVLGELLETEEGRAEVERTFPARAQTEEGEARLREAIEAAGEGDGPPSD